MALINESKLNNCSVPLTFEGHYFLLESGALPEISVIREFEGRPVFEIRRNKPAENPLSDSSEDEHGVVSVFDKQTGRFLFTLSPGLETNVVLGITGGKAIAARIADNRIHVSGDTIYNCVFNGSATTLFVDYEGHLNVETSLVPPAALQLLAI